MPDANPFFRLSLLLRFLYYSISLSVSFGILSGIAFGKDPVIKMFQDGDIIVMLLLISAFFTGFDALINFLRGS